MKTNLCLAIIVVANAAGNLMLGYGMRQVGDISSYSPVALIASGLAAMANPWVLGGVLLLTVFFAAHAIVLSWADLSYVMLVTAVGYGLVTLLSWALLGEQVSAARWVGVAVITAGVTLAGSTPVSTVKR
ncbi:MAG: EamA family transporter [Acidobacteria bacterium]|nr:EamA family transporter [Acidobacteriota bacterium]